MAGEFTLSDQSGTAAAAAFLEDMGYRLVERDPRPAAVLGAVKAKCAAGYSFDDARASLELLVMRTVGCP